MLCQYRLGRAGEEGCGAVFVGEEGGEGVGGIR